VSNAASAPELATGFTVAALFVEKGGVYYGLDGVDPWDEERDARLYDGPYPVVAHPPCKTWSLMGNCRPELRTKGDGGTFAAALAAVEKYGGVLEHPAHSRAWRTFNLPKVARPGWNIALHGRPGWATEVDQAAYGHPCHKLTWLYYVGPNPPKLDWRSLDTGRRVHDDGGGGRDQRSRTPQAFRDLLVDLARASVNQEVAA
jgi:hypothetical protein